MASGVTIHGTRGNDIITPMQTVAGQPLPTADDDTIHGEGGDDRLDGGAGAHVLYGGIGSDTMLANSGR